MRRLGRYEIGRILGQGGDGTVHEAVMCGPGALRREVALKVLRTGSGALRREARIGGLLRHRNLLDVYEVGEDDGTWYCAMERCDTALAALAPLPARAVVEVGIAVCDALQYAHEELGLVHLDLKPDNLLVRNGVVKVADLGIARADGFEHDQRIRGTRRFMAPEQARGDTIDAKADVWALGVTLLELAGVEASASTTMNFTLGYTASPRGADERTTHQDFTNGPRTSTCHEAEAPTSPACTGPPPAQWLAPVVEPCFAPAPADRPTLRQLRDALRALELRGPDLRSHLGLDARPIPAPLHAETNLPVEVDPFVGRQAELETLERALERPGLLLTMKGPGGVGKSRLATTAARRWRKSTGGQAWFFDLTNARSSNGLVTAVARTLDVPLGGGDAVRTLGRAIASRGDAVFIFDNFEQLVDLADVVAQWRAAAPQARLLITSRVSLGLDREHVMALQVLPAHEACALLVARAQSRGVDIAQDPDLLRLANRLEGLPLALELAAGRLGVLAVSEVVERLDQGILRSAGSDRHATLTATLDWSWELLEPAERIALAQLSVFAGSFSLEAAEAVLTLPASAVLKGVDRLVRHSLVVSRGERLALLMPIQSYASSRLKNAHDTQLRHSAWAAQLNQRLGPLGSAPRLRGLATELTNLVAACEWSISQNHGDRAVATVEACWEVLAMLGPLSEAVALAESVCALPLYAPLAARAARVAGSARRAFGDMDAAGKHYQRALLHFRDVGDTLGEAAILDHLGELATARGQFDEAGQRYEQCLAIHGIRSRDRITGLAKGHLGLVLHHRGLLDRAQVLYEEALEIYRAVGDRRAEGVTRGNLGVLHRAAGRPEQAAAHYDASLAIHREIGDRGLEGVLLGNLGVLHHALGNLDQEQSCYQRALAIHRQLGNRRSEGVVLGNLAEMYEARGDADGAASAFAAALVLHREVENQQMEGRTLAQLARLAGAAGRFEEARAHFSKGEAMLRGGKHQAFLAELLATRASVEALAGDLEAAQQALTEAEAVAPGGLSDIEAAVVRARDQIHAARQHERERNGSH